MTREELAAALRQGGPALMAEAIVDMRERLADVTPDLIHRDPWLALMRERAAAVPPGNAPQSRCLHGIEGAGDATLEEWQALQARLDASRRIVRGLESELSVLRSPRKPNIGQTNLPDPGCEGCGFPASSHPHASCLEFRNRWAATGSEQTPPTACWSCGATLPRPEKKP